MADTSTFEEGIAADDGGIDFVGQPTRLYLL